MVAPLDYIKSLDPTKQLEHVEKRLEEATRNQTRDRVLAYGGFGMPVAILTAGLVKVAETIAHSPHTAVAYGAGALMCAFVVSSCFNALVNTIESNDRNYNFKGRSTFSPLSVINSSKALLMRVNRINWLKEHRTPQQ